MANPRDNIETFSRGVRDEACEFICDSGSMCIQEVAGFVAGCICMDREPERLTIKIHKRGQAAADRIRANLREYFAENGIEQELDAHAEVLEFRDVLSELLYTELTQLPQQRDDDMCRAFLRGVFIGSGTVSAPENQHYFDVSSPDRAPLAAIHSFLDSYQIKSSIIKRKNRHVLYVKSGDNIADILKLMGTPRAAMYYEEALIASLASNISNRAYNCYSANVNKFIVRKLRIREMILAVDPTGKLGWATEELKSVAEALMDDDNEVLSLTELGGRMNPPIGKSGAAHRIDRLEAMLREIQEKYVDRT